MRSSLNRMIRVNTWKRVTDKGHKNFQTATVLYFYCEGIQGFWESPFGSGCNWFFMGENVYRIRHGRESWEGGKGFGIAFFVHLLRVLDSPSKYRKISRVWTRQLLTHPHSPICNHKFIVFLFYFVVGTSGKKSVFTSFDFWVRKNKVWNVFEENSKWNQPHFEPNWLE